MKDPPTALSVSIETVDVWASLNSLVKVLTELMALAKLIKTKIDTTAKLIKVTQGQPF